MARHRLFDKRNRMCVIRIDPSSGRKYYVINTRRWPTPPGGLTPILMYVDEASALQGLPDPQS